MAQRTTVRFLGEQCLSTTVDGGIDMSTAEQELDSFTNYARERIESGQRDLSIDELFDQWRVENPSSEQYANNIAAVQASIQDFKNGERGTIAGEHSAKLRSEFGIGGQ
jgi:hypothetical protein